MYMKKIVHLCVKYLLSFFIVILLSFILPRLIPGSPLYTLTGDGSGFSSGVPAAVLGKFEEYYSPELPIWQQFTRYLSHLSKFDLGISFYYKTPVLERILGGAKWTLLISLTALFISTAAGMFLGVSMGLAKKNRGTLWMPPLLAVQSIPTFLLAAAAQIVLAYKLKIFPATGAVTPGMYEGQPGYLKDIFFHMALPLIVLVISEIPSIAIFAYSSTMRIKKTPYVAFAHYLGISPAQIRLKFIMKNILPEMLGKMNIQTIMCIMGSMFVEAVFSYPGLGQLLKNATNYRDYPLMQGILLISCLYGIVINMIFELLLLKNIKVS